MTSRIEEILIEGKKETLPNKKLMFSILNQIPEKKNNVSNIVIKSPYLRVVFTQVMSLCLLLVIVYPTYDVDDQTQINRDLSSIDIQAEEFETYMDQTDYEEPSALI